MYSRIQNFEFPECSDESFCQLVDEVKEGFQIICKGVKSAAENIKAIQRAKELGKAKVEPVEVHPGVYDIAPSKEEIKF